MFNVYIITNLVNGKQYVGLTTKTIKKRLARHIYDAKREDRNKGSMLLLKAIRKYGKENFVIDLVSDKFTSIQELKQGETDAIKKFNTLAPNGYNLKIEEQNNFIYSEQLKLTYSRTSQGRKRAGSSKFVGVRKCKDKFISVITFKSKVIYLGTFLIEKDAAIAYDINAIKLHGNKARVNIEENRNDYINNPEEFDYVYLNKIKSKRIITKFKGIRKHGKRWRTIYSFKTFDTEEDAAVAYDVETVVLNNGKKLNFPHNLEKYLRKEITPNYFNSRKTSKYRGVTFCKNKWVARIFINNKIQHIGGFRNEKDAAIAYDVKSFSFYNDEKRLNFPENIEKYKSNEIVPNFYKNENKSSKYKGVSFDGKRYYARVSFNKKVTRLGGFLTEREAAEAYNQAAITLLGDRAKLNKID